MRTSPLLLVLAVAFSVAHAEDLNTASDSRNTEALLVESMLSISNNRLDVAMNEVDSVLKTEPNFKLAQLVKGDLLLARTRPLTTLGDATTPPADRMAGLRDEARARLQRFQEQSPSTTSPKYLWQLDAEQRYAIVIDTSKSTLYLFKNENGEPRYVADYYITSGKKGSEKLSEGDQKTPLGVYYIKSSIPKSKLTDFYGDAAYPLNYPNAWDRKNGRDGHGIWLHGTPSNTYSRPPRASNGCVVLSNDDLDIIGKVLQVGITPVVITDQMKWSDENDHANRSDLLVALEQWRKDWASIDTDNYLKHYARDFNSGNLNYAAWERNKRAVNSRKSWIKIKISNLSIFDYPTDPNMVVVNFEQDYSSNNLSNRMKKRQYWIKRDNQWKIIYEGAA